MKKKYLSVYIFTIGLLYLIFYIYFKPNKPIPEILDTVNVVLISVIFSFAFLFKNDLILKFLSYFILYCIILIIIFIAQYNLIESDTLYKKYFPESYKEYVIQKTYMNRLKNIE